MMTPTTELCRVTTADELLLDGALYLPATHAKREVPIDAVLLVHGTGSNYYAPGVLETFANQAVEAGIVALRINTRGHDGICSIPTLQDSAKGGATFETISEACHDVQAWITFLQNRGCKRIGLVGHSMGGVKCLYAMAQTQLAGVSHIFGISPPRFCHANFQSHPTAEPFRADFTRAEELVQEGRGDELIRVQQPVPFIATAAGFLAKYGPHDAYDYLPVLSRLAVPTRLLLGSQTVERSPAFAGLPDKLARVAQDKPNFSYHVVDGANINYRSCPTVPFDDFLIWVNDDT